VKRLLFVVAILCVASSSFAQSMSYGLKAGGNLTFSKIDAERTPFKGVLTPGYYGGGFLQFPVGYDESSFKIQVEALYNRAIAQYSNNGAATKIKWKINQIVVPVLAQYFFSPQFGVNLGPTLNLNFGGRSSVETASASSDYKLSSDDLNFSQIGLAAGMSYHFNSGIFIDARYNRLFGKFNKEAVDKKMRMDNVQLGIGYRVGY
jgi:opacity protein-like surface antigen